MTDCYRSKFECSYASSLNASRFSVVGRGHEMTLLDISYACKLNMSCNFSLGCIELIGFCLLWAPGGGRCWWQRGIGRGHGGDAEWGKGGTGLV